MATAETMRELATSSIPAHPPIRAAAPRSERARRDGAGTARGSQSSRAAAGRRRPRITLQQQVLPEGTLQMDMPVHVAVATDGLRSGEAAAFRRGRPVYIDMRADSRVDELKQSVLQALAKANRLAAAAAAGFDSESVMLVPVDPKHTIQLVANRRLWQYFASEILSGLDVKLQLMLTPPVPKHARGHAVETAEQLTAAATAARGRGRASARREPHPPAQPRPEVARVERVDAVAARVVNRVQVSIEAQEGRFDDCALELQHVEEAIAALSRANDKRVAAEQASLSRFLAKRKPSGRKKGAASSRPSHRDHAAAPSRKRLPTGFTPIGGQFAKDLQRGSVSEKDYRPDVAALRKRPKHTARQGDGDGEEARQQAEAEAETKKPPTNAGAPSDGGGWLARAEAYRIEAGIPLPMTHDERQRLLKGHLEPERVKMSKKQAAARRAGRDMSKAGKAEMSAEERRQRQATHLSRVLNNMIRDRRSLYGTMMRDATSAFEALDKDGSGALDYHEFQAALRRLGLGLTAEQTMELGKAM